MQRFPRDMSASPELTQLVENYLGAWNTDDKDERSRLLDLVWAPEGVFVDPIAVKRGRAGIEEHTYWFNVHFPGHKFKVASLIDSIHHSARYNWVLVNQSDEILTDGQDVMLFDANGKIKYVMTYFREWVTPVPAEFEQDK